MRSQKSCDATRRSVSRREKIFPVRTYVCISSFFAFFELYVCPLHVFPGDHDLRDATNSESCLHNERRAATDALLLSLRVLCYSLVTLWL